MDGLSSEVSDANLGLIAKAVFGDQMHPADATEDIVGKEGYAWLLAHRGDTTSQGDLIRAIFWMEEGSIRRPPGEGHRSALTKNTLEIKQDFIRDLACRGRFFDRVVDLIEGLDISQKDDRELFLLMFRDIVRMMPHETAAKVQRIPFQVKFQDLSREQLLELRDEQRVSLEAHDVEIKNAKDHRKRLAGVDYTFATAPPNDDEVLNLELEDGG